MAPKRSDPETPHAAPAARRVEAARSGRTVSALFPQTYLLFGLAHGIHPEQLCREAGIRMSDVADRESQVPYAWAAAALGVLIARLPQLAIGLELGQLSTLGHLGYLGQTLRNSQTPLHALKLLVRNARLVDSAYHGATLVVETDSEIEFRTPALPFDAPEAIEMAFVSTVKVLRELVPTASPKEVRFTHDRDAALHARFTAWFRCPVLLAADRNGVVLDRTDMERPLPGADPTAFQHLARYVGERLEELKEPFVTVASRVIETAITQGRLSQGHVAKQLGLSARNLQRVLHSHGASYQALVTQARLSLATRLLGDRSLAVYEVAFALGYDDVSAFNRAFRRWTGLNPSSFRADRAHARSSPVTADAVRSAAPASEA